MIGDSEAVLREKLKVALQDAKTLFDEGLLDEYEFKGLKAHELDKYKEQLDTLTVTAIPLSKPTEDKTPPVSERKPPAAAVNLTPLHTPLTGRLRLDSLRPSPVSRPSPASVATPPSLIRTPATRTKSQDDVLYVDANTFARLTTPPIFRRRSKNKRKIRIPSAELKALQGLPEKKANAN